MGGRFSKSKATVSSNNEAVISIKVPGSEKTRAQFEDESQKTALILKERRKEQKLENQIKAANAERLAAAEAERLAADEELAREAKKKALLTAKDIEDILHTKHLSSEEFEKYQEEKQIKENQEERRKKIMETLRKQKLTEAQKTQQQKTDGGNNKNKPSIIVKKEILGKKRCIYKKTGDRKEYVKYKGNLITVKDYKKIIKARNNKRI
jgi:hypothetical protein